MMRGYSLSWGPEKAFLKDLKEPARGEIGAENGEEALRDREPLHSYSPIRKKDILPFATTWIDLEYIMLSEIRQMEKVKYCIKTPV